MPDDVLKDARERFRHSEDGSSHIREAAREDVAFARLGDQWPEGIKRQRDLEGRPCLTINRLPSFIRQVVNDARQNKPGLIVVPVDGGADYDTAQIIGGLLRAIERGSNAGVAYDTAVEHAVTGGFGFFRIALDWAHAESFDMEARIERVANPFSVHWDVDSTSFDASDWEYAFVSDLLTEDEFKRRFPKAKPFSFEGADRDADTGALWTAGNKVRVAEYWLRTQAKRKILLLSDGTVMRADAMQEPYELEPGVVVSRAEAMQLAGVTVARAREAEHWTVKRRLINAEDVLEENDWPGTMIPIAPVWGEEVLHEGRRYFRSLVRDARDPQKMFNFWRTASTELVALAPRAPFIMPEGALPIDPVEAEKWRSANTRSHAYLTFRGPMAPQRQAFAGVPAGALQEALNASDDMKAVMGIYDASLGARSNETSGRAIMARQRESDTATFHFIDNLARAIQYAGRCLIELIPSVYSARQTVQILGPDEAPKVAQLTQQNPDPKGGLYNVAVGKYDVTVKVGPSYATQREEAREALLEMTRMAPQAALVLGDLILKQMDFPEADEAAERVKLLQQLELQRMGMPPPGAAPPAADPMMQGAPQGAPSAFGGV